MKVNELKSLIEGGESENLEFKRKIASDEKIARSLVGFANCSGGRIMIGVDDDGTIVGIESEKIDLDDIKRISENLCTPKINYEIEIVPVKNLDVIVIKVIESKIKPHFVKSEVNKLTVYVRNEASTIEADKTFINILNYRNKPILNFVFGEHEKNIMTYLNEYKKISIENVIQLLKVNKRKASRLLINLFRMKMLNYKFEKNKIIFVPFDLEFSINQKELSQKPQKHLENV